MLASFNKHIVPLVATPCRVIQDKVVDSANRLSELTFNALDSTTTALGTLLPNLRPTGVGEVILQTKKTGSALLTTNTGDVLIEISKDKNDHFIFVATDDSLTPTVFYEGDDPLSGIHWEVKVSDYLQDIIAKTDMVSYGACVTRWKDGKFDDLKKQFVAQRQLRKSKKQVILNLPDEKPLKFTGKHVVLKAESALKYFYQSKKTPKEEAASETWDLLNRLFVGYLYFSGILLAPWVNDHVLLPHQKRENAEKKAREMTDDGFLDTDDLIVMAKDPLIEHVMNIAEFDPELSSQLEEVTFKPNGYIQRYEFDGRTYTKTMSPQAITRPITA